ncbi:nucleotidyltransferase domain-containing protein [Paenibacillus albiflavus]|uniref:Nucleotidyltransferase domain-containing protein n=1 Tax=Paenibacillus albiflavus TaxID=2545760 RepID=A0A4R4EM17_9BACL|nr:nucleotidyltransferase domain-containing protein [Paenibacillus albiflavus]TCZ79368.1 nucleotidyltransferase domain-containing protein [Paenibacillus albiflavus]
MNNFNEFISDFRVWVYEQSLIIGVALVGSYARGDYKIDSDVDIVIITKDKNLTLEAIENNFIYDRPIQTKREEWGIVTSLRVYYSCGLEVEFGVVGEEWVKEPLDQGTVGVITNGFSIVIDKENVFESINKKLTDI